MALYEAISGVSTTAALAYLAAAWFVWGVYKVFYRLYLHPLAKFPGPRLARITYLYECYYDIWLSGQYTWKLRELHDKYGSVIRLNPDELHFDDPEYFDSIFYMTNENVQKPYKLANAFGPYPAAIGTVEHDVHRVRRSAVNPFFSRRSVVELVPCVNSLIEDLCDRLEDASRYGEKVNMRYAFTALTVEIMYEYCFSRHGDRLQSPDFGQKLFENIDEFIEMSMMNRHMPWLFGPLFTLPDWILRRLHPAMADVYEIREIIEAQIGDIKSGKDKAHEGSGHRTILHDMLSSKLPPSESAVPRLRDEAFSLTVAGSHTTSYLLKVTTYHIMANPHIHARLVQELRAAMPTRTKIPDLLALEKLPYLTAVIMEGLRISNPISHRMSRAYPDRALEYNGRIIPPGTPVHMTQLLTHENEKYFPEPKVFNPERWLGEHAQHHQRHFRPFGGGTRGCLGINLAWAETYMTIGTLFRRFEFDVSEVDRARDIDTTRDLIPGYAAKDSPGMIVTVKTVA